jgi:hypothetical protein
LEESVEILKDDWIDLPNLNKMRSKLIERQDHLKYLIGERIVDALEGAVQEAEITVWGFFDTVLMFFDQTSLQRSRRDYMDLRGFTLDSELSRYRVKPLHNVFLCQSR